MEHYHSCTTSKKVIGKLYNKNIVIGDVNIVSPNEIYAELNNDNELVDLKVDGESIFVKPSQTTDATPDPGPEEGGGKKEDNSK